MLITLSVNTKEPQVFHGAPPITSFSPTVEVTSMDTVPISSPPLPPPLPPPPPPPPPPPGPPPLNRRDSIRRSKLRNLNWERIPKERVEGRRSVWSGVATAEDFTIDLRSLDELFSQKETHRVDKVQSFRRSLIRCGSPQDTSTDKVALLDAKRSMNVGIFLRQFKSAAGEIVEDLKQGAGERYGAEKLSELCKLLPDSEEEKKLRLFQGDRSRLGEPDLFMVLLVEVPSFRLRLDAMILQQEFDPAVTSLCVAARCLGEAARELLNCRELHSILHLVLKAGNYMNAGGYAGNAAGFRIASLLKLADTKANKPGMNLLHFVAMEAVKKNPSLLSFSSQLSHVGPASRQSEESVREDLSRLGTRVEALRVSLQTEVELQQQMQSFVESAEGRLGEVEAEVEALQKASQALVEFFCEDETSFKLEEACRIFYSFCHRFQRAVQENAERELQEQRRAERQRENAEKRSSIAACTGLGLGQGQDDLERTLEKSLSYSWHRRSLRHPEARRTSLPFSTSGRMNADASHSRLGLRTATTGIKQDLNRDAAHSTQGLGADVAQGRRGLNADTVDHKQGLNADTACSKQVLNTDSVHCRQEQSTNMTQSQQALTTVVHPSILNLITDITHNQQKPNSDTTPRLHGPPTEELPANVMHEKEEHSAVTAPIRLELPSDATHTAWDPTPNPSESTTAMVPQGDDLMAGEPSVDSARLLRLVSERVLRQQGTLGVASPTEVDMQSESMVPEPVPLLANDAEPPSPGSERSYPRVGETLECHTLVRGLRSYESMTSPISRPAPSHCSKWRKEREADERDGAKSPQNKDDARSSKDPARGARRGLMTRLGLPSNPSVPRVRSKTESASPEEGLSTRVSRLPPPRSASVRSSVPPQQAGAQLELKRAASAREKVRVVVEQVGKLGRSPPEGTKPEKDKARPVQGAFVRGSPLRVTKRLAPNPESHTPSPPRTVQNPSATTAKTIRKAVITAAAMKTAKNSETSKPKSPGTRLPGSRVSRPASQPASQPMWR